MIKKIKLKMPSLPGTQVNPQIFGLDDESVRPAGALVDLHADLAVAEVVQGDLAESDPEVLGDAGGQLRVGVPRKQPQIVNHGSYPSFP